MWQLAGGAVVGLVVGGGDEVPDHQEVVARKILVHRHDSAGTRHTLSQRCASCGGTAVREPRAPPWVLSPSR
jgi:hypothetical protein